MYKQRNSFEFKVRNILILCISSTAYTICIIQYIQSAVQNLKHYLPQFEYVTCFVHAFDRVSEQIWLRYSDVDI